MMTVPELIGSLISAYALGWVWGTSMLAFKRFMEVST